MYGRFGQTAEKGVRLPFFNPSDEFARYGRVYELDDEEARKTFGLKPDRFRDGLIEGEQSKRLWVESVVRVNSDWIPVGQPSRRVTPIAIQTNKAVYLYSLEVERQRVFGGTMGHFGGRVLDLSACVLKGSCATKAMMVLQEELAKQFQAAPLGGLRVKNQLTPPNQLRFSRITEESEVLKGLAGPYYEISTYTINVWPGPADGFVGTGELYFSWVDKPELHQKPADQLFLQIDQALQIAVGRKGSYEEPKPDQYAAYQRAVNKALETAIESTTRRLGGVMSGDGVGVIPRQEEQPNDDANGDT
jgi:hypothetical protein